MHRRRRQTVGMSSARAPGRRSRSHQRSAQRASAPSGPRPTRDPSTAATPKGHLPIRHRPAQQPLRLRSAIVFCRFPARSNSTGDGDGASTSRCLTRASPAPAARGLTDAIRPIAEISKPSLSQERYYLRGVPASARAVICSRLRQLTRFARPDSATRRIVRPNEANRQNRPTRARPTNPASAFLLNDHRSAGGPPRASFF